MHKGRQYPVGAEYVPGKGTYFRVWAPRHKKAKLLLSANGHEPEHWDMENEKNGYFSILCAQAAPGMRYWYKFAHHEMLLADPASRYQPDGPTGPSMITDRQFSWNDEKWAGVSMQGQIIYEMHIGTFTEEGTFKAAAEKLVHLAELGVTVIEIMPLNDFPGRFGWGYDGVYLFAPCHLYGRPEDLKKFIDRAHKLGLAVILDVVYNHFGPECNQMAQFTEEYITSKYSTEWGDAINFDNEDSRIFFLTNVRYWIEEFHFDGLRVDATPWLFCSSQPHILAEISRVAREAGNGKQIIVIGENEPLDSDHLKSYEEGGYGFDGMWNDDFHHTAMVRLTGKREAYYTDYLGTPQEFISAAKYGFLYQGQYYDWQKKRRGKSSLFVKPESMVVFLENHDQVANTGRGERLAHISDPGCFRAMTALLLLGPNTPLLFQGQEFGSSKPFYYFADHNDDLNKLVHSGRKEFLEQFSRLSSKEAKSYIPDPSNPMTFTRCKLDFSEKERHAHFWALHFDLIKLRKQDPVFSRMSELTVDGAVLNENAFILRYFGKEHERLLLINFGPDLIYNPAPEPLLGPPAGMKWSLLWSSEAPVYGGEGIPAINIPHLKLPGHSALVLRTAAEKKRQSREGSSNGE